MKAFITLLSSENYCDGVLVLYRSLKAVKSTYPLHCLLSYNISKEIEDYLCLQGIVCVRLKKQILQKHVNQVTQHNCHWNYSFDKLCIWGLTQYEKLVFVDSDMLVLQNLDHLFEKDAFTGVCAGKSYPGHEKWTGVNSGLLVIVPDLAVEADLLHRLPLVVSLYREKGMPVGDQDVLNNYLGADWSQHTHLHLDEGYNLFADYLTYYIKNLGYSLDKPAKKIIYVIHFIGQYKPWMRPTWRNRVWLFKMRFTNSLYFKALLLFRQYLN